jgi:hypothetical protein
LLFIEIEPNIKTTPMEVPKSIYLQGKQYSLLGLFLFHSSILSKSNHFIFKFFDGKNFFDIDNLRQNFEESVNNELCYNGKKFIISAATYFLNE